VAVAVAVAVAAAATAGTDQSRFAEKLRATCLPGRLPPALSPVSMARRICRVWRNNIPEQAARRLLAGASCATSVTIDDPSVCLAEARAIFR